MRGSDGLSIRDGPKCQRHGTVDVRNAALACGKMLLAKQTVVVAFRETGRRFFSLLHRPPSSLLSLLLPAGENVIRRAICIFYATHTRSRDAADTS